MAQQVMCFDTVTSLSRCSSFPTVRLPTLPSCPEMKEGNAIPDNTGGVATLTANDNTMAIVGTVIAVIVIILIGIAYFLYRHVKKKGSMKTEGTPPPVDL